MKVKVELTKEEERLLGILVKELKLDKKQRQMLLEVLYNTDTGETNLIDMFHEFLSQIWVTMVGDYGDRRYSELIPQINKEIKRIEEMAM